MGYSISLTIRRLLVLWAVCFLHQTVAWSANHEFAAEIRKGEEFLAKLFEPGLDLLPEYKGAKVYWLYHDNYLAAKILGQRHPAVAKRIQASMQRFGVTHSGK